MKVCVVGLGYIGLPTVALLAKNGISVHGVDVKDETINALNNGKILIIENGLSEVIKFGVEKGLINASKEPEVSDVFMVVVPTPFKGNKEPDVSFVVNATEKVIPFLKKGDLFIIESTSPVGTTEMIATLIADKRPDLFIDGKWEISIAYCPERVLPGNILYELEHNDRVIGGIDDASTERAVSFYHEFVKKGNMLKTNARTAEMCKLVENASRDVQIAFANELSMICEKADIDVWDLIRLANHHPRVNILTPGCGVGGHCIAVDPYFITHHYPNEAKLIDMARRINTHKASWCIEQIIKHIINFHTRPKVALMGLAFKPNIDDLRESPAKFIVKTLSSKNLNADFLIVEPNICTYDDFMLSSLEEVKNADIVVFLVAHDDFKNIPIKASSIVLDYCGITKKR